MSDGSLLFDTKLDTKGFEKGMDGIKNLASKGLGGLASITKTIAASTTIAATALTGLGAKCVSLASDLSEVQNVVDVTFGDSADKINEWSKTMATSFGISELQAKKMSGTLGAMVKSMGITGDQLQDMSTGLTELSGDFASFYNLDPEEAFEKIRAGISGETEPLKQLGINMSVANLEAYALSEGITKAYKDMTQAEQATLRYSYLMSVSADAQGDFARTSDSLANQMRILKLGVEDLGSSIGESLLPLAQDGLKKLNDSLGNLKSAFDTNGFEGLVEALGTELSNWLNIISSYIPKALEMGISVIDALVRGIVDNLPNLTSSALDIGMTLLEGIGQIIPMLAEAAVSLIERLCNGLTRNLGKIIAIGEDIIISLWNALVAAAPMIADAALEIISTLCEELGNALPTLIPYALEIVANLCDYIIENLDLIVDCATDVIDGLAEGLINALPFLLEKAPVIIQNLCDELIKNIDKVLKAAVEIIEKLAGALVDNLPKILEAALKIIIALAKGLVDSVGYLMKAGAELVADLCEAIMNFDWIEFGKNIIKAIAKGIKDNDAITKSAVDATLGEHGGNSGSFGGHSGSSGSSGSIGGPGYNYNNNTALQNEYMRRTQGNRAIAKGSALTDALNILGDTQKAIGKAVDEAGKQTNDKMKDLNKNYLNTIGEGAAKAKKKTEQEIIDGTARYAALERQEEVKRSDEYLKLKDELATIEQTKLEEGLAAKEAIGLRGIQESYNKWLAAEKKEIEAKQKIIDSVDKKLKKQSDALSIAQQTKDLKGAYKVLAALEVELTEGLDEKIKEQKLKDIANYNGEVKQKQLDALEEANTSKLNLMKQGLEDEKNLMQEYQNNYTDMYDNMVSAYENAYNTIMSKQTKLEEKFKAIGDLYDIIEQENEDGTKTEYMALGNIAEDVRQLQLFSDALVELRKRGASNDFIEEIVNMDTGKAMDFTELLLKQSDSNLNTYMSNWEEKQRLAKELSADFYKDEVDDLKANFTDKAKEELGLVAEDAEQKGRDTAQNFIQGLLSKKDEMKAAIAQIWQEVGLSSTQLDASGLGAKLSEHQAANKDNGVGAALNGLIGALNSGAVEKKDTVILDGRKVGESSSVVDGVLRELRRRGVELGVS